MNWRREQEREKRRKVGSGFSIGCNKDTNISKERIEVSINVSVQIYNQLLYGSSIRMTKDHIVKSVYLDY